MHSYTPGASGTEDQLDADFRQVYEEIELARRQAAGPLDPQAASQAAAQLHQHLANLIEMQELQDRRSFSRTDAALLEQARYLKVALADEILLHRPWAGREAWSGHLLETALFRTSVAGERVLDQIEDVLRDREPAQRPLARLYLFALALGFQGRWRGQPGVEGLPGLRRELYQFVYQRQPEGAEISRRLAPQAYAHTLSHLAPRRQRTLSRSLVLWLIGLVALLALSELLWLWPTWPLRQALGGLAPAVRQEAAP
ncbi:MAG: hypothetical protein RLZZ584_459 [Pseudomonadota bacterium]|jgi:type VI secretion system protein ImpK